MAVDGCSKLEVQCVQKALGVRGPLEAIQCCAAVSLQGWWREWTDMGQEVQIMQTFFFFLFFFFLSFFLFFFALLYQL